MVISFNAKFYINVPIPGNELKKKASKIEDRNHEYVAIRGELYLTLVDLIQKIGRKDSTVSNIDWKHEIKHKHEYRHEYNEQKYMSI
jgi:hypothetical protein